MMQVAPAHELVAEDGVPTIVAQHYGHASDVLISIGFLLGVAATLMCRALARLAARVVAARGADRGSGVSPRPTAQAVERACADFNRAASSWFRFDDALQRQGVRTMADALAMVPLLVDQGRLDVAPAKFIEGHREFLTVTRGELHALEREEERKAFLAGRRLNLSPMDPENPATGLN